MSFKYRFKRKIIRKINPFLQETYSQEGEDLIIRRLFPQKKGFYVDIGAFHPMLYSNTYLLYNKGWRGINVEPNFDNFLLFKKYRRNDINVFTGIHKANRSFFYYTFEQPALNTFDGTISQKRVKEGYPVKECIEIPCITLKELFNQYLDKNQEIDLLTIDVEGLEKEVLFSYDFDEIKPTCIIIEILNQMENEITNYLQNLGYSLFYKLYNSRIFMK